MFNGTIYSCFEGSVIMTTCPKDMSNLMVGDCKQKKLECDDKFENTLWCMDGILTTNIDVVCNSTFEFSYVYARSNETILECFEGSYPENLASFVPTTAKPATKQGELSFAANAYLLILRLLGKADFLDSTTEAPIVKDPREGLKEGETPWVPEAITFPPGLEVVDLQFKYSLEYQRKEVIDGEVKIVERQPVEADVEQAWLTLHAQQRIPLPPNVALVEKRNDTSTKEMRLLERKKSEAIVRNDQLVKKLLEKSWAQSMTQS